MKQLPARDPITQDVQQAFAEYHQLLTEWLDWLMAGDCSEAESHRIIQDRIDQWDRADERGLPEPQRALPGVQED